jgi:lactate racemase
MRIPIEYGDGKLPIDVPDGTPVVRAGVLFHEPDSLEDPVEVTRRRAAPAPRQPAPPRARERFLAGGHRLPRPREGGAHATAHRRVAIPLILDELANAPG